MPLKSELRRIFRDKRRNITDKTEKDKKICRNILESDLYRNANQVLCYYPLEAEIDTRLIISSALADKKRLALPYCVDTNGNMEFYYINSFKELRQGSYDIMEPDIEVCEKVSDFSGSICIVPGFSFDKKGYRLGYGKGYYDKFLKKFTFNSIGLCYNNFLSNALPAENHDTAVNFIATENKFIAL